MPWGHMIQGNHRFLGFRIETIHVRTLYKLESLLKEDNMVKTKEGVFVMKICLKKLIASIFEE